MVIAFQAELQCLFALTGVKFFDRNTPPERMHITKGCADCLESSVNQGVNRIGRL